MIQNIDGKDYIKILNKWGIAEPQNFWKEYDKVDFEHRKVLIDQKKVGLFNDAKDILKKIYACCKEIWADIAAEFSKLDKPLKEAFSQRQTKQIRTEDMLIEINVTGTKEDSLVNIQISGGSEALKLRDILNNLSYIQKEE